MNPIEKAIRNALDKGDAGDRAFREKVYRSVHAALERTLQANPGVTPDILRQRRQALKTAISAIESEFIPAVAPPTTASERPRARGEDPANDAPPAPPVEIGSREPAVGKAPVVDPDGSGKAAGAVPPVAVTTPRRPEAADLRPERRRPAGRREPAFEPETTQAASAERNEGGNLRAETRPAPRRRRGRLFAGLFLATTVVAAVSIGVWWVAEQGLLLSPEERDTSVPNPPKTLEEEEFQPADPPRLGSEPSEERNWITIFSPDNPGAVVTPAGASAEVVDADGEPALRIRGEGAETPILFDVGQGVLQQIAGRRTLFDIVARAEEGQETQVSVTCNFGELGDCGRNRYSVVPTRSDYLFDLTMPDAAPGAAGTIAIVPDVDAGARAIEVFEIRVSISQ
ncbi:MAG: hypothetical protein ABJE07_15890 [Nitratireductor sp.]